MLFVVSLCMLTGCQADSESGTAIPSLSSIERIDRISSEDVGSAGKETVNLASMKTTGIKNKSVNNSKTVHVTKPSMSSTPQNVFNKYQNSIYHGVNPIIKTEGSMTTKPTETLTSKGIYIIYSSSSRVVTKSVEISKTQNGFNPSSAKPYTINSSITEVFPEFHPNIAYLDESQSNITSETVFSVHATTEQSLDMRQYNFNISDLKPDLSRPFTENQETESIVFKENTENESLAIQSLNEFAVSLKERRKRYSSVQRDAINREGQPFMPYCDLGYSDMGIQKMKNDDHVKTPRKNHYHHAGLTRAGRRKKRKNKKRRERYKASNLSPKEIDNTKKHKKPLKQHHMYRKIGRKRIANNKKNPNKRKKSQKKDQLKIRLRERLLKHRRIKPAANVEHTERLELSSTLQYTERYRDQTKENSWQDIKDIFTSSRKALKLQKILDNIFLAQSTESLCTLNPSGKCLVLSSLRPLPQTLVGKSESSIDELINQIPLVTESERIENEDLLHKHVIEDQVTEIPIYKERSVHREEYPVLDYSELENPVLNAAYKPFVIDGPDRQYFYPQVSTVGYPLNLGYQDFEESNAAQDAFLARSQFDNIPLQVSDLEEPADQVGYNNLNSNSFARRPSKEDNFKPYTQERTVDEYMYKPDQTQFQWPYWPYQSVPGNDEYFTGMQDGVYRPFAFADDPENFPGFPQSQDLKSTPPPVFSKEALAQLDSSTKDPIAGYQNDKRNGAASTSSSGTASTGYAPIVEGRTAVIMVEYASEDQVTDETTVTEHYESLVGSSTTESAAKTTKCTPKASKGTKRARADCACSTPAECLCPPPVEKCTEKIACTCDSEESEPEEEEEEEEEDESECSEMTTPCDEDSSEVDESSEDACSTTTCGDGGSTTEAVDSTENKEAPETTTSAAERSKSKGRKLTTESEEDSESDYTDEDLMSRESVKTVVTKREPTILNMSKINFDTELTGQETSLKKIVNFDLKRKYPELKRINSKNKYNERGYGYDKPFGLPGSEGSEEVPKNVWRLGLKNRPSLIAVVEGDEDDDGEEEDAYNEEDDEEDDDIDVEYEYEITKKHGHHGDGHHGGHRVVQQRITEPPPVKTRIEKPSVITRIEKPQVRKPSYTPPRKKIGSSPAKKKTGGKSPVRSGTTPCAADKSPKAMKRYQVAFGDYLSYIFSNYLFWVVSIPIILGILIVMLLIKCLCNRDVQTCVKPVCTRPRCTTFTPPCPPTCPVMVCNTEDNGTNISYIKEKNR